MDRFKLSLLALQRKAESQLNCEGPGGIGKGYLANARKGKRFLILGVETSGRGGRGVEDGEKTGGSGWCRDQS